MDWMWLGFVIGLAFLMASFLIGPRVPAEDQKILCIGNIYLGGPFGFGLNCDSPEFMWLARDPSGLLKPESPRQARPGLIIAAAIVQMPISLVVPYRAPPQPIGQGTDDTAAIVRSFQNNLPTYLAYILLNIGILLVGFFLTRRIMERDTDSRAIDPASGLIILSTGFLLVANDVTKAFVWSPHTQMFNILVPVLSLYVILRLLRGGLFERSFVLSIGLATGLGMIAYPFFALVTACAIPPTVWTVIRDRKHRQIGTVHLAALIALSIAPSLLWYAFVRAKTGAFFQYEMAQGQVVWMANAWAKGMGPFLGQWLKNLWSLLVFAAPQAIPLAAIIAWLAIFALRHRAAYRGAAKGWTTLVAAVFVSIAGLGFYTCVGWIVDRLAYPMIPPLIIAAGAAALARTSNLSSKQGRELAGGFLFIAIAQMIFVVVKNGPWS
jgi:4-amino-4-deoxy-L-arabinose transferase-like glycosyltransferase